MRFLQQSFYRFQLTNMEKQFIFKYTPQVAEKDTVSPVSIDQRMAMVQRILSQDTATQMEALQAKKQMNDRLELVRKIKSLQLEISAMAQHAALNHKDKNAKRKVQERSNEQRRLMKVLKQKSPLEYIEVKQEMNKSK